MIKIFIFLFFIFSIECSCKTYISAYPNYLSKKKIINADKAVTSSDIFKNSRNEDGQELNYCIQTINTNNTLGAGCQVSPPDEWHMTLKPATDLDLKNHMCVALEALKNATFILGDFSADEKQNQYWGVLPVVLESQNGRHAEEYLSTNPHISVLRCACRNSKIKKVADQKAIKCKLSDFIACKDYFAEYLNKNPVKRREGRRIQFDKICAYDDGRIEIGCVSFDEHGQCIYHENIDRKHKRGLTSDHLGRESADLEENMPPTFGETSRGASASVIPLLHALSSSDLHSLGLMTPTISPALRYSSNSMGENESDSIDRLSPSNGFSTPSSFNSTSVSSSTPMSRSFATSTIINSPIANISGGSTSTTSMLTHEGIIMSIGQKSPPSSPDKKLSSPKQSPSKVNLGQGTAFISTGKSRKALFQENSSNSSDTVSTEKNIRRIKENWDDSSDEDTF